MVRYEAVCELKCQQIIVIYWYIAFQKNTVISRVKYICFKGKINLTMLWPGSKRCAHRSKITQERRATRCQSWASVVSCSASIGTAMVKCLFIEPLHSAWWTTVGLLLARRRRLRASIVSALSWHLLFTAVIECGFATCPTSRQTGLINTLNPRF